jgi:hypothetical protein
MARFDFVHYVVCPDCRRQHRIVGGFAACCTWVWCGDGVRAVRIERGARVACTIRELRLRWPLVFGK